MSEEQEKQSTPINQKKRTAMLRYMAIMFAVAFALVMLSYLIQTRNSQTTISQLNATSASALQNAEELQAENRTLIEENHALRIELNDAQAVAQEYQESAEVSRQNARMEGLEEGRKEAREETQRAYDLLLKAMTTEDNGELLKELEAQKGNLSESALSEYEALE